MIKKIISTLLAIVLLVSTYGYFDRQKVEADSDAYKVAWVNNQGGFDTVSTYADYQSAYNKMIELGNDTGDYVVISNSSLSSMGIVAMNRGLVYAFPYRNNSKTLNIYAKLNDSHLSGNTNAARTYVAANNYMYYHGTAYHFNAGEHGMNYDHGYVKVTVGGFVGYSDLEYVDLVPMKMIENHFSVSLSGNGSGTYSISKPVFNIKLEQNRYYAKQNGNYRDLVLEQNYIYGTTLQQEKCAIGVAPNFMVDGMVYYSEDGINFYTDRNLKNLAGTYYNYYQFVPARSYTKISANTINSYIAKGSGNSGALLNKGADFVNSQNVYGFNACIAASIGIHESAWGKSLIAENNCFGIAAYDDNLGASRKFNSISDCINSLMGDVLGNYFDVKCSWYYSNALGVKGGGFITSYASDPYWAEEVAQYYYAMDKYDNNNNGNLTDYNSESIALVNSNTSVTNSSGAVYYNTANKFGYQKYLTVNVLSNDGNRAMIRTSNPISNGVVQHAVDLSSGNLPYDKNQSIGYIASSAITPLNFEIQENVDPNTLSLVSYVRNIKLNSDGLYIEGVAAIKGINATNASDIKHQLIFKSLTNDEDVITVDCDTSEMTYSLNDGKSYKYVKFSKTIPLSTFDEFMYETTIKVTNGKYSKSSYLLCPEISYNSLSYNSNKTNYRLLCDPMKSYRIMFNVDKLNPNIINLSNINKVSIRPSNMTCSSIKAELFESKPTLNVNAHGFIYYLNYDNKQNIEFNLFVVDKNGEAIKAETSIVESPTDYTSVLNSEYDLTNICFNSRYDLSNLDGEYRLIVQIKNVSEGTNYMDYIYVTNPDNYVYEGCETTNKKYSFVTDKKTNMLYLKAETIEAVENIDLGE
ncbi:MAG: glucosaminidase domain-containing protein [Erysipelotrichaceae bacterium]|nr:glucosaminidase domain-containing protein [Erysipelotrichaceae bacterium]